MTQSAIHGSKPLLLPNGVAYRVNESWFDLNPPFLEFYDFSKKEKFKPDGSIYILLQDSRGDIWLTDQEVTNDLIRFDGLSFKYFRFSGEDTTALGVIKHMVENADGKLWFSHEKGVSCFDPEKETFRHFLTSPNSLANIPDAYFDKRSNGVPSLNEYFDTLTEVFTRIFPANVVDASDPNHRADATINWVFQKGWRDEKGHIWLNGSTPIGSGLVCVKPEASQVILYPMLGILVKNKFGNPDYDPWITSFFADKDRNKIWVSGWRGGLRCFDLETKRWTQFVHRIDEETSNIGVDLEVILFILPAPSGKLWLGTLKGISLFDPINLRFQAWWDNGKFGCIKPGAHNAANAYCDPEGRLWLAEGNFMVHDPKRFFFHKPRFNLPEGRLEDAVYDPIANKTWFLVEPGADSRRPSIVEVDEASDKITNRYYLPETRNYYNVDHIVKIDNELYFTAENQFYCFDLSKGRLREIKIPLPVDLRDRIKAFSGLDHIQADASGAIWLAISHVQSGVPLIRYTPWDQRFEYIRTAPGALSIALAGKLFIDSRGLIWIGCNHTDRRGVNCYDPRTGNVLYFTANIQSANALNSNLVYDFAEDSQGHIWMTTDKGLCYYDPSTGLMNSVPGEERKNFFILVDKSGTIWLSGDAPAMYKPSTREWRACGPENGLHIAHAKLYLRKDGIVCWGAYYRLSPERIPILEKGPPVRITSFRLFDTEANLEKNIHYMHRVVLSHDNNYFTLSWSAQNFTSSSGDQYAYQLVGIDTGWVYCGQQNMVSYPKISPGNYQFCVKAANRDGIWGPEKILLITISPAWYQTIWFKAALFVLIFAGVYSVYKSRLQQIKISTELRQKEAEFQQRLAEVQMSALRAQMNPHFIFNSLSSINRFIQFKEPDIASNYLTKFSRLIRLILDNSREDVVTLAQELQACRLYLEIESLRFTHKFLYTINISPDVQAEDIKIPPLLLQPYLENAIWHGLMQKESKGGQLFLTINRQEQMLCIEIEDNGIGREKAQAIKSKSVNRNKSHGMDLTKERMKLFQLAFGMSIDVQITDIRDQDEIVRGTKVTIIIQLPP